MAKKKKAEEKIVEAPAVEKAPAMVFELMVDRGSVHRPQWETVVWDGSIHVESAVLILKRDGVVVEAFSVNAWKTIKAQS